MSLRRDQQPTEVLIERALQGEDSAFDSLFGASIPRLVLFVRREAREIRDAGLDEEDVIQQVLERARGRLAEFSSRGSGSFHAWLVTLARYEVKSRRAALRHSGRRGARHTESIFPPNVALAGPEGRTPTPSTVAAHRESIDRLEEELSALPDDERRVIELHMLEERTFRDIAESTGTPRSTVLSRFESGMATLRRKLGAEADDR